MDFDADIIPGRSIGGLALGEDALELVVRLQHEGRVSQRPALNPDFSCYQVDEALVLIVDHRDFRIVNLAALAGYRGRLFGYIHAGMSVHELIAGAPSAVLKAMRPRNEFLYLDRAQSVGFVLPPDYDDVCDRVEDLPADLRLEALYVVPASMHQVAGRDGKLVWRPVG
ncbi:MULTISPECIES: hypothetical protein [unclassified Lysobacter]|uniref:hypothetical protein n=1 Tax=unclassified Lysobacter TaxID=2635362 RepID=UPI001BE56151|nr:MULTISPECIES: hypothetical protein [unclassified Lysobacter]MBT2749454.1 hypothetical protein [Lysobacter sp. ISL-42]MBT2753968.1 hypothetical protein [Lysobacter sp. ISL-50]MBT2778041.1 hypothetical protein [Lysobacter sp. ISL-54]MBT2780744.1 hypothetical protein [Lysobacter sp. ISL-52]